MIKINAVKITKTLSLRYKKGMKLKYSVFICMVLILAACKEQPSKSTIVLTSSIKNIKYVVNGNRSDWRISPDIKPDVLKVECSKETNSVGFLTDHDSAFFFSKIARHN